MFLLNLSIHPSIFYFLFISFLFIYFLFSIFQFYIYMFFFLIYLYFYCLFISLFIYFIFSNSRSLKTHCQNERTQRTFQWGIQRLRGHHNPEPAERLLDHRSNQFQIPILNSRNLRLQNQRQRSFFEEKADLDPGTRFFKWQRQ